MDERDVVCDFTPKEGKDVLGFAVAAIGAGSLIGKFVAELCGVKDEGTKEKVVAGFALVAGLLALGALAATQADED